MKFILILEKRPYKEKELTYIKCIYSFDEDIYKTLVKEVNPSNLKVIDIDSSLDLPYTVNDAMEWFDLNHRRRSDYECWLLDIKDPVEGYTFDEDGNLIMMTDTQKKLSGQAPLSEGTYIKDGKIYKDGLYQLKSDYGKDFRSFYSNLSSVIDHRVSSEYVKEEKLVEFQGKSYQVSQDSVNTLSNLIIFNNGKNIVWRDYSNNMNSLTKEDASSLLIKMNDYLQKDKFNSWEIKDWIESEYNKKESFDIFFEKLKEKLIELGKFSLDETQKLFLDTEADESHQNNEPLSKKELKDNLSTLTEEEAISLRKKIINRY